MHFCSMPMYLVVFTIPSTMCRPPTPPPAMQSQTIILRGSYTVRFRRSAGLISLPENLLTYVLAWLPNRQKVLSSLDRTSPTSHKLQLAYCLAHWILLRLWTLVISGFLRALQPLGTNCRHRRHTV